MNKKFDKVLLKTAYLFSELSHCKRLKVGAVIAKDGRPLVTGYNGNLAGTDNKCEETLDEKCDICGGEGFFETPGVRIMDCSCENGFKTKTKKSVIHAEQNCIFYSARNGIKIEGCDMYITHAPCEECSKAIIASGIKRIVFSQEYRNSRGIDYLRKNGLEVTTVKI